MPDFYAGEQTRWAVELLIGLGFASFVAATVRELFRIAGNRGKSRA